MKLNHYSLTLLLILSNVSIAIDSPHLIFPKTVPASYASEMITNGQAVYRKIQSNSIDRAQLQKNPNMYLKDIASLVFYFFSKAVEKKQGFSSGSIVIKDPEFKVYDFLYNYVALKWKPHSMTKEVLIDIHGIGAHPRKSSHFNNLYLYNGVAKKGLFGTINKTDSFIHYGIDMPNEIPLPAKKHHVLFGRVQNNPPLTFIKMEQYGLGKKDVIQHAYGLGRSQSKKYTDKVTNKLKKSGFVQKSYLGKLLEQMASVSSDDENNVRRENIPLDILTEFIAIQLTPGSPVKKEEIDIKGIKGLGIRRMLTIANEQINNQKGTPEWRNILKQFADQLRRDYDHTEIRLGKEVILTPENELKN